MDFPYKVNMVGLFLLHFIYTYVTTTPISAMSFSVAQFHYNASNFINSMTLLLCYLL
jgi:hypothetical protein